MLLALDPWELISFIQHKCREKFVSIVMSHSLFSRSCAHHWLTNFHDCAKYCMTEYDNLPL